MILLVCSISIRSRLMGEVEFEGRATAVVKLDRYSSSMFRNRFANHVKPVLDSSCEPVFVSMLRRHPPNLDLLLELDFHGVIRAVGGMTTQTSIRNPSFRACVLLCACHGRIALCRVACEAVRVLASLEFEWMKFVFWCQVICGHLVRSLEFEWVKLVSWCEVTLRLLVRSLD